MANARTISDDRLAVIRSLIRSDAEEDRAQVPAIAAELLAEVDSLYLALASRDQHIEVLGGQLVKERG